MENLQTHREISPDFFESIEIDISNECNLFCPLCHRNATGEEKFTLHHEEKQEMTLQTIMKIDKKFKNLKTWYLGFLICEPFLHKDILKIIDYLKMKDKHLVISTNGNVHVPKDDNDEWAFWYSLRTRMDKNDKIIWSVDGLTQDVYKKYRRGGKLKDVLETLTYAINYLPFVHHEIQTIEFKHNEHQLREEYKNIKSLIPTETESGVQPKITYNKIPCCGDCSLNKSGVEPLWDLEEFKKIRKRVFDMAHNKALKKMSGVVECESNHNKIIFVDHLGRIGFCPTHLTRSVKLQKEKRIPPVNVVDDIEDIQKYINQEFDTKTNNPVCQFNCGTFWKVLKDKKGLGYIKTQ